MRTATALPSQARRRQEPVGRQEPTFLWVPAYRRTRGREVVEFAAQHGLVLDPWNDRLCDHVTALAPRRRGTTRDRWLCFENAVILSRQNGKNAWLRALELAWLFEFGEELVMHSAHLFETCREHFLLMQALIRDDDDLSRRVRRIRESRGSEEIVLLSGARLKFMTRKGGAGRGFTGSKVVIDESMYLDAEMMAAALPTLATRYRSAQVIYTGSAGMKHSTQLALLRRRGYARSDPALMFAEWAAQRPIYGPDGSLLSGDDPEDPATWAKTNPNLETGNDHEISADYVRKEAAALGGFRSPQFWRERLGVGDYPGEDAAWLVIGEPLWLAHCDPGSQIADDGRPVVAVAMDADRDQGTGTIGVCGLRADGREHVEVIDRHRGMGWMVERAKELAGRYRMTSLAVLRGGAAASHIDALQRAGLPVWAVSEVEYARACGQFYETFTEGAGVHIGQKSVNDAVGGGSKVELPEGGWRWDRDAPVDPAPVAVCTLALAARRRAKPTPEPEIFL